MPDDRTQLATRDGLLRAHEDVEACIRDVATIVDRDGHDRDAYLALEDALFWRAQEIRDAYLKRLPARAVSRCPFTNELLVIRIDTTDLDGLWWSATSRVRETIAAPSTFVGLTGAVALATAVPDAPFAVEPGPGAPFVLPDALAVDDVVAVVSAVPIGPHTGYAVAYFSKRPPHPGLLAARDWGALEAASTDLDFDLRRWIERGKLRWIAPSDASLRLRSDAPGCPYLDVRGTHELQVIERGDVR